MGRLLPNHWNVLGACLCKNHLFDKAWRWHSSNEIQSTWITLNNHNPLDNPWSMRFPYLLLACLPTRRWLHARWYWRATPWRNMSSCQRISPIVCASLSGWKAICNSQDSSRVTVPKWDGMARYNHAMMGIQYMVSTDFYQHLGPMAWHKPIYQPTLLWYQPTIIACDSQDQQVVFGSWRVGNHMDSPFRESSLKLAAQHAIPETAELPSCGQFGRLIYGSESCWFMALFGDF